MRSLFLWGHAQILILKIFHIVTKALTSWRLRLIPPVAGSPSLTLLKIKRFETGSLYLISPQPVDFWMATMIPNVGYIRGEMSPAL